MDNQQLSVQPDPDLPEKSPDGAVRQMRIRIGLLAQGGPGVFHVRTGWCTELLVVVKLNLWR